MQGEILVQPIMPFLPGPPIAEDTDLLQFFQFPEDALDVRSRIEGEILILMEILHQLLKMSPSPPYRAPRIRGSKTNRLGLPMRTFANCGCAGFKRMLLSSGITTDGT